MLRNDRNTLAAALATLTVSCAACIAWLASPLAQADEDSTAEVAAPASGDAHARAAPLSAPSAVSSTPVPQETSSVTEHAIRIGNRLIDYTATAGTLLLRDARGEPDATMFYVAYAARAKNTAQRPVTFLFNGGPGAGSLFLLMGSVGPVRVHTRSPAATPPAPYVLSVNPDSLLDKTDLVFVDALGTGFSRPVGSADAKRFYTVDGDLDVFSRFIERYLSVNQRWNSPKFLIGESYGTARAAMLAYRLGRRHILINGVVLLSSALNANIRAPGYDLESISYLPSYAAVAWYHDKISAPKPVDLSALLDEVRAFAAGPYAAALAKGDALPERERDTVAAQIARYTGLDERYVIASHLRIRPSRFRKELLRGEARSVGRYDGRAEGIDADDVSEAPDYDASESSITSAFDAAFHDHLAHDLHYASPIPYRVFNDAVLDAWSWKHHAWSGEMDELPYAAGDLGEAMRQNPNLRVLSANGYFDLATPFFSTEYDLAHMGLEPSLRSHFELTYYASGHMIYLDDNALHALKRDLARFYDIAAGASAPAK